jgi:hypothetical protein
LATLAIQAPRNSLLTSGRTVLKFSSSGDIGVTGFTVVTGSFGFVILLVCLAGVVFIVLFCTEHELLIEMATPKRQIIFILIITKIAQFFKTRQKNLIYSMTIISLSLILF